MNLRAKMAEEMNGISKHKSAKKEKKSLISAVNQNSIVSSDLWPKVRTASHVWNYSV